MNNRFLNLTTSLQPPPPPSQTHPLSRSQPHHPLSHPQLKAAASKKEGKDRARAAAALSARAASHERLLLALNALNTTAALLVPCWAVHANAADLLPAFALTLMAICLWMKLVSYAHCHADLRAAQRADQLRPGERGAPGADPRWAVLRFPENLTLGNMLWFLAAPTLVYQVSE